MMMPTLPASRRLDLLAESRSVSSAVLRETLLGALVVGGILLLIAPLACAPDQGGDLLCVEPQSKLVLSNLSVVGLWKLTAFLLLSYLVGLGLSTTGDIFVIEREPIERTRERISTVGTSGNDLLIDEWRSVRQFREDMRSALGAVFMLLTASILYLIVLLIQALATGSVQWLQSATNPFTTQIITTLGLFFLLILGAMTAAFFFMRKVVRPWATSQYETRLKRLDALGGLPSGSSVFVDKSQTTP